MADDKGSIRDPVRDCMGMILKSSHDFLNKSGEGLGG